MSTPNDLSLNIIDEWFCYNNKTQRLHWRKRPQSKVNLKKPAGYKGSHTYWTLNFKGSAYSVHRITYLLFHRSIPDGYVIDHINGNTNDNRIENLRAVPHFANIANCKIVNKNKRFTCVKPTSHKTFKTEITWDGERRQLGTFKTPQEAAFRVSQEKKRLFESIKIESF